MGRGRGFRGADSGSFTGNFRGGGPVYHPTNEIDFEIQQWSELAVALIIRFFFAINAFPRRIATKRAEHSRRPG